ncbi:Chemokine XC receptor 1 [Liparis tanakae]|uniref:Chemokine XC receptor 1 n=1 Tax=Liparis tanakae TaxID=230148 RepID=A0A4Z2ITR4_9TELE|nr:Chemokine XC receptor 1 [Liparis tanakae]
MDTDELIESIVRALMFLAGILGNNWLVIRSLPRQKSGMRTNEILFINLAVSNLITNCLVDLPDTIADFAGRWFLGETFCAVFRFCADLSETSSIYSTFFISAYWYQKLVGSLKRGGALVQMDSLCLVGCLLAGSWTVALVFSIPHFFFVAVEGGNESEEDCVDMFPSAAAKQTYEIFYLTLANALPLAGIVFASTQIVVTLLRNRLRIQGHNSDPAKEATKGENKSTEGGNDQSVSAASAPSASDDPESAEHIYDGAPASSCPSGEPSGPSSALNKDANADGAVGAPPNPPRPAQVRAKPGPGSGTQVRAAKSVVAVAGVFLVCWLTHLVLRISNNIQTSPIVLEVASYVAASYTCIIPYIFLYGVKKLSCSCKR